MGHVIVLLESKYIAGPAAVLSASDLRRVSVRYFKVEAHNDTIDEMFHATDPFVQLTLTSSIP